MYNLKKYCNLIQPHLYFYPSNYILVWFKPYIDYFFNNQIYLFPQTQKHSYTVKKKIIYDKDHTLIQYIYF